SSLEIPSTDSEVVQSEILSRALGAHTQRGSIGRYLLLAMIHFYNLGSVRGRKTKEICGERIEKSRSPRSSGPCTVGHSTPLRLIISTVPPSQQFWLQCTRSGQNSRNWKQKGHVQAVVIAAHCAGLAALDATDDVYNGVALHTNHGPFDGSDDAKKAGHLEEVLVVAIVHVRTYLVTIVEMRRTIAVVDLGGSGQDASHDGCNSEIGDDGTDGEHVER
ncbi:15570_t:CDS:2, partial [Acaulospora colombiana]